MPPSRSTWRGSFTRCDSRRRVVMPVNTTDVIVHIMFIANGHITLRPNNFHNASIMRGNPGKTDEAGPTLPS